MIHSCECLFNKYRSSADSIFGRLDVQNVGGAIRGFLSWKDVFSAAFSSREIRFRWLEIVTCVWSRRNHCTTYMHCELNMQFLHSHNQFWVLRQAIGIMEIVGYRNREKVYMSISSVVLQLGCCTILKELEKQVQSINLAKKKSQSTDFHASWFRQPCEQPS